jgi:hypothetical protein
MANNYPLTGTPLKTNTASSGLEQATNTAVSTNIIILVEGQAVGAVQSINYGESRTIHFVDEIGTDGHIDSVPQKAVDIQGSAKRVRFAGKRIAQAFQRGFVHVSAQRRPFDIVIVDYFQAKGIVGSIDNAQTTPGAISTTLKNCWITRLQTAYQTNEFVITEDMDFQAETIYSRLHSDSQTVPVGTNSNVGGDKTDTIERSADYGARRGALDASGLMAITQTGELT